MKRVTILALVIALSVTFSACNMIPVDNVDDLKGLVNDVMDAANQQIADGKENVTDIQNNNDTRNNTEDINPTETVKTPDVPAATANGITVTREEAIKIALDHAGFQQKDVMELDVELDRERGVYEWEVDFEKGGYEYSYDIDAATGRILWSEKERDD